MSTENTPKRVRTLGKALALAIVAPTQEQAAKAVRLCDMLASGMTEDEVEAAKRQALGWAKMHMAEDIEWGAI